MAADVVVAVVIAALAMEASMNHHTTTIPIMLVLSLLGFAGSLSMARFVADRDKAKKWDVPDVAADQVRARRVRHMNPVLDIIGALFLLLGAMLCFAASVGLVRFPDVLTRMHAATKPQTLGLLFVVAGVAFSLQNFQALGILLLVAILQLLTAPVAAHMVSRTAYRTGQVREDLLTAGRPGRRPRRRGLPAGDGRRGRGRRGGRQLLSVTSSPLSVAESAATRRVSTARTSRPAARAQNAAPMPPITVPEAATTNVMVTASRPSRAGQRSVQRRRQGAEQGQAGHGADHVRGAPG